MKKTNTTDLGKTNLGKILQTNAANIEEIKKECQELYQMFINLQQENAALNKDIASLRDQHQILEERLSDIDKQKMIDSNRTIQKGNTSNNSFDDSFELIDKKSVENDTFLKYVQDQGKDNNLPNQTIIG